jgi:hypothetical protein
MKRYPFLKKAIKPVLLAISLLLFSLEGFAQYVIKGRVVDAESQAPLEFATVFVNNSTFGAITDGEGGFEISVPPGNHELVISYMGYSPFSFSFTTESLKEFYEFRILPQPIELEETQVAEKRDKDWYRSLETFKEKFLGTSINAQKCRVLNPEVLILDAESEPGVLKASAKDVLEIHNPNLGYRIRYVLTGFEYDQENGRISFAGYPYFVEEDLPRRKAARVEKNRERAYQGSVGHLMRSLYLGTSEEEGFEFYAIERKPNPERPHDSQISQARAMLEKTRTLLGRDSLRREVAKEKLASYIEVLSEEQLQGEEILERTGDGKAFLTYDRPFYTIFTEETEEPNFRSRAAREVKSKMNTLGTGIVATATGENGVGLPQSSRIEMLGKAVQIFENGSYFHPFDLYLEGYMAWEKIGDLMPFDFGMK